MKKKYTPYTLLCAFMIYFCGALFTFDEVLAQGDELLQVSVAKKEPFVFVDGGKYSGFAVELWDAIAQQSGWKYEYNQSNSLVELLRTQKKATADAAIGDVVITADRKEVMDFSDPTFDGGLQIITYKKDSLLIFASALRTPEFGFLFGAMVSVLFLAIHGLWIGERSREDVGRKYLSGIGNASWSLITLGGFGKMLPQSSIGRFSLLSWMCIFTACLSLYIASVSSALTAQKITNTINSYHDVSTKNVGALKGSIALEFMREKGMDAILYESQDQMFEDVENQIIDAAISDVEQIQHEISRGSNALESAGDIFHRREYGIGLPIGSNLTSEINEALEELKKDGRYADIHEKWFK